MDHDSKKPRDRGWSNWSGSLRFQPSQVSAPQSEEEIVRLVRFAAENGRTIRPVGSGHSSTPLVQTDDILIAIDGLSGLVSAAPEAREITFRPGTRLREAGETMLELGLAPPNLGDIDMQTVAGTVGTGTHGTGVSLRNLSDMLVGGRIVTGTGAVRDFSIDADYELMRALRVSLGSFGIFTELRLRVLPAYLLCRREWCTTVEHCVTIWDELGASNRNVDFYWYPRTDEIKLRILNPPGEGDTSAVRGRLLSNETEPAAKAIPKHSGLSNRFDEMEHLVPADAAMRCFAEVRERIRKHHRRHVGWRVLVRSIAADEVLISPAHGRASVSISVHQNAGLPHEKYFRDIEPIFRDFGGRPHWAKKHSLRAPDLSPLYPEWDRFRRLRFQFDPQGVFLSAYLADLLGEEHRA